MKAKLTPDGQKKYISARENYQLSDEIRDQLKASVVAGEEVKDSGLTIEQLCRLLNPQKPWDPRKYHRVFFGDAFLAESEAKHVCNTLQIDFAECDWVAKLGTAPDWKWDSPTEVESKRKGFVGCEGRKDDDVVLGDGVLDDQQPCNPVALRAQVSDGSIPDPFARSDFHLKVRVVERPASMINVLEPEPGGGASLSCQLVFSVYQGRTSFTKEDPKLEAMERILVNRFSTDQLRFLVADPSPLIDAIKELINSYLELCRQHLGDKLLPLNLHLHLLLPATWLSGPLPEAIRQNFRRQVFFGFAERAKLAESAITQHRAEGIRVNQTLCSGSAISTLRWATVCGGAVQPVPLAQLFQSTPQAIHLNECDLDNEVDHRKLVGRDALLAAEQRILFAERYSDADEVSTDGRQDQRWRRLAKIGLPLVFWWRDAGTLAENARLGRLEAVMKGSWSEFCDALHRLPWERNPEDKENEEKMRLLANLGIFYEEPLRCLMPAPYNHPLHTAP